MPPGNKAPGEIYTTIQAILENPSLHEVTIRDFAGWEVNKEEDPTKIIEYLPPDYNDYTEDDFRLAKELVMAAKEVYDIDKSVAEARKLIAEAARTKEKAVQFIPQELRQAILNTQWVVHNLQPRGSRANSSRAARLIGWFRKTKQSGSYGNPRKSRKTDPDYFDPRTWSLHAQTNAIYESMISRSMMEREFRSDDAKQMRLDARAYQRTRGAPAKDAFRKECRNVMGKAFATTSKRGRWVIPGSNDPTDESIEVSRLRYEGKYVGTDRVKRDLNDLVNGRQSYEEMLGFVSGERRGFYRVCQEPTQAGLRYFVWPMPPGQRVPGPASRSKIEAEAMMEYLNETADPRVTKKWHVPDCAYTKRELAHWLPPEDVFEV